MVEARKVRLKRRIPRKKENPTRQKAIFILSLIAIVIAFMLVVRYMVTREASELNRTADLESRGLHFQLQMDKARYRKGEPVDVQLSVTNISDGPITLRFDEDQEFDFLVQREVNLLFVEVPMNVWRYSSENIPQEKPHTIVIEPSQQRVFKATWTQRDFEGQIVRAGRYIITGFLNAKDRSETLQLRGETNE